MALRDDVNERASWLDQFEAVVVGEKQVRRCRRIEMANSVIG
jgi:hypothetical protein